MKFFFILALFVFISICILSFLPNSYLKNPLFWFDNEDKNLTNSERIVNKILYEASTSIEKKYNLKPIGTGISMPGGVVKNLSLAFDPRQRFSKDQLRELTIQFSTELLNQINSNEEIQPSLVKRPFTIENVEIVIYNHDKQGYSIYDPEIAVAHLDHGIIDYKTNDPENEFKYKNRHKETYEEALQLTHNKN
ncbi:MAG: hypothetical protein H0T62_06870 [Parachlamydiaceae bacterium]|nr:hypothetical protein [Parachlamydiaceae bacterium]